jgi:DNA-binding transcriptional LysR family regulator
VQGTIWRRGVALTQLTEQRMNQVNLNDLATFQQVAATGSFAGAARALGVPKSTVKRRVDRLEDEMGTSLVVRSGRRAALTESGAALARYAESPLKALTNLDAALSPGEPSGTLRIAAPPDLGSSEWFVTLLARYRAAHPNVSLDVDLATRFVDLNEERVDLAIRPVTPATAPNLRMKRLRIQGAAGLYASAAYLERHGRPRQPKDLPRHDGVILRTLLQAFRLRRDDERTEDHPRWTTMCSDFNFASRAIVAGLGIGPLPPFLAKPLTASGQLQRVLSKWSMPEVQVAAVWAARRIDAPRVRAFLDLLPTEAEL